MSIKKDTRMKVYNYSPCKIAVQGRQKGYLFEQASDGFPTFELMDLDDIEYINSKSPVFRTGALRFDAEYEEEIFHAIGMDKVDGVFFSEEDIDHVLVNASPENQKKIIGVKDIMTIERIRGRMVYLVNTRDEHITTVIQHTVNERFAELNRGLVQSRIAVREAAPIEDHSNVQAMLEQNAMLLEQIKQMQEQIKQMQKPAAPRTPKKTAAPKKPAATKAAPVATDEVSES